MRDTNEVAGMAHSFFPITLYYSVGIFKVWSRFKDKEIPCNHLIAFYILSCCLKHRKLYWNMVENDVKNRFKKPLIVFTVYAILNAVIYSLGGFLLADGWNRIDSSWCRDFLYTIFFWVWPPIICISIIHLLLTIVNKKIAIASLKISFSFGFAGPLLLYILVSKSQDTETAMAYIGLGISYFAFALAGFIISCIVIWMYKMLIPRHWGWSVLKS